MIKLGNQYGNTIATTITNSAGIATFEHDSRQITATVLKATNPDIPLTGATVHLLQRTSATGEPMQQYALMVDDPYWGRRIQPAGFTEENITEIFAMGYRLRVRILENGIPKPNANVSLELTLADRNGDKAVMWDSLEYNGLVYDTQKETYVAGALVYAPLRTNALGECEFIVPKGHGAIYQRAGDRRDETAEAAAESLPRYAETVKAVYLGRKVELTEGQIGEIDILSGSLQVTATPGAIVRISTLDAPGQTYTVPAGGVVTAQGLPAGEHNIVQFKRNGWGEWDASWECPRATADVQPGETTSVTMAAMVHHDMAGNVACGRVYKRMGVPAAGLDIVLIDWENCEVGATVATTDGSGYFEVAIPDEGLGGELWVHDEIWGSVPLVGYPYSEVVLGARAYSSFSGYFRPEAWRTEDRGHKNFPYVDGAISVKASGASATYATTEAAYGGWQTVEALPAYQYATDIEALLGTGPQKREYDILDGETVLEAGFTLAEQSFESGESLPGHFRAAGHYPEATFLIGGKIAGNVVLPAESTAPHNHISAQLPEALRAGLEFGMHSHFVQMRVRPEDAAQMEHVPEEPAMEEQMVDEHVANEQTPEEHAEAGSAACVADFTCPYCGGPAHRDPDTSSYARGHCIPCADAFGQADAVDCRTYFITKTLPADAQYALRADVIRPDGTEQTCETHWHWRPDIYAETDDFLTQQGIAQATNAPRWLARHVSEVGDGKGFGTFDAAATPPFTAGHDVAYFEALAGVQRTLGLSQMKIIFPTGYTLQAAVSLEITCVLADLNTEKVALTLAAGLHGPTTADPLGDVVLLSPAEKLHAEILPSPYAGCGLYRAVNALQVTSTPAPADCIFSIVNDNPWLAGTAGIPVQRARRTPAAMQIGTPAGGGIELLCDAVGQLHLFYTTRGNIWMTKRSGLAAPWAPAKQITSDGRSSEPTADKDDTGTLALFMQSANQIVHRKSRTDGLEWEI